MDFGTDAHKLARNDSPDTSKVAAQSVNTTDLERLVYEYIVGRGYAGCIAQDVLDAYPTKPYSSITARFSALISRGYIVDTGERRPGRSGKGQRVVRAEKVSP